jgi:protoporphyrinogen oxidase
LASKQRIAVLGGGAAGVTAAGQLARSLGAHVDLFEAAPVLGGLHKSVTLDGQVYDVGAFVFGAEHALLKVFPELRSMFAALDARYRRITPAGTVDHYPMSIRGYVRDVGLYQASLATLDMLSAEIRYRHPDTVAAYAYSHMGRRIYESSGLKAYVERLYGRPDSEIDLQFALQRLRYLGEISIAKSLTAGFRRVTVNWQ